MRAPQLALAIGIVLGLLWQPVFYSGGKAALLLLDLYSPSLVGTNLAALITPEPRESRTTERIGGVEMRVDWWRPGWGDEHPGLLVVNGATPAGNENAATRSFAKALARAGYLVMLPEFPFLKEGRLDPDAPRAADAAFAMLRARTETRGRPVGVFGASVGGGIALVAAGSEAAIARADHVTVLGAYFDLDTYVAAVAGHSQPTPNGLVTWEPSAEAQERIPPAVERAMTDDADRARVRRAFDLRDHGAALAELARISPPGRAVFDRLSPSTVWPRIEAPVFWIHDPNDNYEPLAEAVAAQAAPRNGHMRLFSPGLVQHAEVGKDAGARGPLYLIGELWSLLAFTLEVLRIAG